jgi:methyl-accepting chemotaxis protein
MTVGRKLLVASAVSAVLIVAVGATGYWGIGTISAGTDKMMKEEAKIAEHSARVRANVLGLRRYEKDILINIQDLKKVEEYEKKFKDQRDHLAQRIEALRQVVVLPKDKDLVKQMAADLDSFGAGMTGIIEKIKTGQITTTTDGNKAVGEYKDPIHRLEKSGDDFSKEGYARMAATQVVLSGRAQSALWTMGVVALVAVVTGIALSMLISRSITAALKRVVEFLQDLQDLAEGQGDLTKRLEVKTRDELGELSEWVNTFMEKLHDIISQAKGAASQVAAATQQLSAASEQLSSGAQEQASSLEETAASLEEITGTVKQNADNAREANQLAVGSRDVAEKGGQVVVEAVRSMTEINRSSKKIADIITTIDEIAFQTNLLALNAAVEAARAGEQGRGFAVVASEVRNLAQRSATAAKEIKGLIQDSVAKVEAGSELVNKSGETLNEIVSSVKRVTDIIAEIAAASQEQSTGIDQVNVAVTQLDQVTQSNAAQTEELSSTAQSLAAQAQQLQALVGGFKVESDGHVASKRAATGAAVAKPSPVVRSGRLERRASDGKSRGVRKTDEPVLAAVPVGGNGKGQHKDDGFEEF